MRATLTNFKAFASNTSEGSLMKGWEFFLAGIGDNNSLVRSGSHSLRLGKKTSKTQIMSWNLGFH